MFTGQFILSVSFVTTFRRTAIVKYESGKEAILLESVFKREIRK